MEYYLFMVNDMLTTGEVAKILGLSRIAIFKKIKTGKIKAKKVGRNFIVQKRDLPEILGTVLAAGNKREIETAVKKTVKEYGQTLKLLGKE